MVHTQFATQSAVMAVFALVLVSTQAHAGISLFTAADDGAGSLAIGSLCSEL